MAEIIEQLPDRLKESGAFLHEATLLAYDKEALVFNEAKSLAAKAEALVEAEGGEVSKRKQTMMKMESLKLKLAHSDQLLQELRDKQAARDAKIDELEGERGSKENEIATKKQFYIDSIQPQIKNLNTVNAQIGTDITRNEERKENLQIQIARAEKRITILDDNIVELEKQIAPLEQELAHVQAQPDFDKGEIERLQKGIGEVTKDLEEKRSDLALYEADYKKNHEVNVDVEEEIKQQSVALTNHRNKVFALENQVLRRKQEIEQEQNEQKLILAERSKFKSEVKDAMLKRHALGNSMMLLNAQHSQKVTDLHSLERLVRRIEEEAPRLKGISTDKKMEVRSLKEEIERLEKDMDLLAEEIVIKMSDVVRSGMLNEKQAKELIEMKTQHTDLFSTLTEVFAENRSLQNALNAKLNQRNNLSLELSKAAQAVKADQEAMGIKVLRISELDKRVSSLSETLLKYQKLYAALKNERNLYLTSINNNKQAVLELKEKFVLLQNELKILQKELAFKAGDLSKIQLSLRNLKNEKLQSYLSTNRLKAVYLEKEAKIATQLNFLKNHTDQLNAIESQLIKLRKVYANAIDERNYLGLQLIDRNDELAILYEKSNLMKNIVDQGMITLDQKESEIHSLNVNLTTKLSELEVVRKAAYKLPHLQKQITALESELIRQRSESSDLGEKLEDPTNTKRFNFLKGHIPDMKELLAKKELLETALAEKKEQLIEKDLVLDEFTVLAQRMKDRVETDRELTKDTAKKLTDSQYRLRRLTRKTMALVAELSMTQAQSMQLGDERGRLEDIVDDAHDRMEKGEPPTEDADLELQSMLITERIRREQAMKARLEREEDDLPPGAVRTTAEPRPTMYIPRDGVGIPRPYSIYRPFKPSQAGATMRHIRPPRPTAVIL
ncbi:hypothetical protein PCE1_002413 [Barthelona sp. PCE]